MNPKTADHELKTVDPWYSDVEDECKTAEIRKHDRDFAIGETVKLRHYDVESDTYSGRFVVVKITHVLTHEQFPEGLQPEYCMFSFDVIARGRE